MQNLIGVEIARKGLAVITFLRAERRNALSIAMLKQLCETLDRLVMTNAARVAILRGDGPVFSAGLDLAEASNPELVEESAHCVANALEMLQQTSLVTIAAVCGGAYAGGAGIVAACDFAVGATDAKIAFPEARRGLIPALISEALRWKVREGDLRELFLVGDSISADRAQQIGLFQRVVASDKVLDEAIRMAESVLAGGPQTITDTKKLLNEAFGHVHDSSTNDRITDHLSARRSLEAAEGLAAFLEKRKPNWIE